MNELGYFIAETGYAPLIKRIRKEFIELFGCKSDEEVIALYKNDRPRWVKTYDQLRCLPEIYGLAGSESLEGLATDAGLQKPAIGAKLVVRCDMPNDDAWSFPPHQDYPFNRGSLNSVTIWIPFQTCDENNGALRVIPKSHTWGEQPSENSLLLTCPDEQHYVSMPIRAGQALVFSQFLIHKSGPNRSNTVRFSLQIRYNDLDEMVHRTTAVVEAA
jgi:phytanoyl-CoA hydroxylase